jgi:hypothetical protein
MRVEVELHRGDRRLGILRAQPLDDVVAHLRELRGVHGPALGIGRIRRVQRDARELLRFRLAEDLLAPREVVDLALGPRPAGVLERALDGHVAVGPTRAGTDG